MENHTLTVDGDVGEGGFGTPPHEKPTNMHSKTSPKHLDGSRGPNSDPKFSNVSAGTCL
jgi:hypothetical protein